jgi:hypothetical protein
VVYSTVVERGTFPLWWQIRRGILRSSDGVLGPRMSRVREDTSCETFGKVNWTVLKKRSLNLEIFASLIVIVYPNKIIL